MLYLFQHSQQVFDGGRQGVGGVAQLLVEEALLLLRCLQGLLRLAQGALHLLQLPGQRSVGLLHLSFHLPIFPWKETTQS